MADEPGWTRVPNAILDDMKQLGNAELRVYLALVRRTAGFNKEADTVSLSQLEKQTGLGRQHVHAALNDLLMRNYITRTPAKRGSFTYQLVTLGNQSLVTLGNTQNKEKEISKEKKTATRKRATVRPRDLVFETVAAVCGIDWTVCTEPQRQQLNRTVTTLRRAAEKHAVDEPGTLDRIRHTERYWQRIDWRGKQGQPPTPAQLREVWGAAMKTYKTAPVEAPTPRQSPTEMADPAEIARLFRGE